MFGRSRLRSARRRGALAATIAAITGLLATALTVVPAVSAVAAEASEFDPGYIISDELFYDRAAMTEAQIQSFLAQNIGSCSNSNCLNVYKQTTTNREATPRCTAYTGAANESAARIIFKVQQACGISAKVLLVTLQKEQSLVTHRSPTADRLKIAMGYGCPDTALCDSHFFGFQNQVYSAASQFQRYRQNPSSFRHQVGVPMKLYHHPNSVYASPPSCGTVTVTIKNAATAGLYNYTPYTPNPAALANLYGTGDSCSSYGNRNFWRMYTDWFGSPIGKISPAADKSRFAGSDRYETSVSVSQNTFFDPALVSTVYIASGENFPDGLSGAPAATAAGAPMLLTKKNELPAVVKAEIQRLAPDRIILLGASPAVSNSVQNALAKIAPVTRIGGADRYETSRMIARYAFPNGASEAIIAIGNNFPDALAAGGAAGNRGIPVILVPQKASSADSATRALIAELGVTRVIATGDSQVIRDSYISSTRTGTAVTQTQRLGGVNRYQTAALINEWAYPDADRSYIVSGANFPDALSAAAVAGAQGAALHLSPGGCIPAYAAAHMTWAGVSQFVFVGSSAVLNNNAWNFRPC